MLHRTLSSLAHTACDLFLSFSLSILFHTHTHTQAITLVHVCMCARSSKLATSTFAFRRSRWWPLVPLPLRHIQSCKHVCSQTHLAEHMIAHPSLSYTHTHTHTHIHTYTHTPTPTLTHTHTHTSCAAPHDTPFALAVVSSVFLSRRRAKLRGHHEGPTRGP